MDNPLGSWNKQRNDLTPAGNCNLLATLGLRYKLGQPCFSPNDFNSFHKLCIAP